jgi:hypothetical protein
MSSTEVPARYTLPKEISLYSGQINGIDSHECTPIQHWVDEFGSAIAPLRDACITIANQLAGREVNDNMPPPLVAD